MSVITLGPEGSFSHEATKSLFPKKQIVFTNSTDETFLRLPNKEMTAAVVPLENSLSGFSEATLVNLMKYDFTLQGKITLKVRYSLAGTGRAEEAQIIYAQPHAVKQCEEHLKKYCPQVKIMETVSNGHAALQLKAQIDPDVLALTSPFAVEFYKLPCVIKQFEDNVDSQAIFFIIGKTPVKKTGSDASSFLIFSDPLISTEKQIRELAREKKVECLKIKNLLLQEGHTPLYFIEVRGHIQDRQVAALFETLSKKFLIKHLGSYPE